MWSTAALDRSYWAKSFSRALTSALAKAAAPCSAKDRLTSLSEVTTCRAVTTYPSGVAMKPVPRNDSLKWVVRWAPVSLR